MVGPLRIHNIIDEGVGNPADKPVESFNRSFSIAQDLRFTPVYDLRLIIGKVQSGELAVEFFCGFVIGFCGVDLVVE